MWCVNAGEDHLDVMSRKPGAFHKNHEKYSELLDEDTIAHASQGGVVFTSQPIPQGSMFQVKILEYTTLLNTFDLLVSGVSVTHP